MFWHHFPSLGGGFSALLNTIYSQYVCPNQYQSLAINVVPLHHSPRLITFCVSVLTKYLLLMLCTNSSLTITGRLSTQSIYCLCSCPKQPCQWWFALTQLSQVKGVVQCSKPYILCVPVLNNHMSMMFCSYTTLTGKGVVECSKPYIICVPVLNNHMSMMLLLHFSLTGKGRLSAQNHIFSVFPS